VTSQAERKSSPGPAQSSREAADRDAFAQMFDAHAQHIFDYCYSLLGDRARAASATQVTLITAHSLAGRLKDTGRMRAFVLALGRWECLSGEQGPAGAAEPDVTGSPGTEDLAAALAFVDLADDDGGEAGTGELTLSAVETSNGLSLRAMLEALPREDREILDLHYRHDVSSPELAPVLGVRAASVPGMLAAATAKFARQGSEMARPAAVGPATPGVRAEQLSAVPLVSLPASVWRRTARVVIDPRFSSYREAVSAHADHLGPDGFPVQPTAAPSSRKLLLASALMAGLLLAPAAAGGAVYAAVGPLSHVVGHQHSTAVTPGAPTSGGATSGGPAPQPRESASRPPHHKPSPSPVRTSLSSPSTAAIAGTPTGGSA
jgi:DNA-directed RNA polymerase specialized sigma24 family protein